MSDDKSTQKSSAQQRAVTSARQRAIESISLRGLTWRDYAYSADPTLDLSTERGLAADDPLGWMAYIIQFRGARALNVWHGATLLARGLVEVADAKEVAREHLLQRVSLLDHDQSAVMARMIAPYVEPGEPPIERLEIILRVYQQAVADGVYQINLKNLVSKTGYVVAADLGMPPKGDDDGRRRDEGSDVG